MEDNIYPLDNYYYLSDYLTSIVPTSLSVCNSDFKSVLATCIDNTLTLTKCNAFVKDDGHDIIEKTIPTNCSQCGLLMCKMFTDVVSKNNKEKVTRLNCYFKQLHSSVDNKDLVSIIKMKEMIQELKESGWIINVGTIIKVETMDLYESLVAKKSFSWFEDNVPLVRFPLNSPNECGNVHIIVK